MKPWLVAAWIAFCTVAVLWLFWAPLLWLALAIDGTDRDDYDWRLWVTTISTWLVVPVALAACFVVLMRLSLTDRVADADVHL